MSAISAITIGDNLPGYEVGDKTAPAVIMIQEWWGVTEIIKRQAELLATRGYRVLIPDLYKGKVGVDAEEASHLMGALDFHAAVKEIGQAAKYLLESGSPKVGITGFCMGGALAFAAAEHVPDLTCTVPCYGTPKAEYFKVENIKIPVLGLFGDNDKHAGFADEATARAVEDKIKAAGGDVTIHIVKGGVHGFLNQLILPEGPPLTLARQGSITPEEEVTKAWEALVAFFDKHLK